ncbi:hypothetical protein CHS0354_007075, partial [Potamilus streckersoni]
DDKDENDDDNDDNGMITKNIVLKESMCLRTGHIPKNEGANHDEGNDDIEN